jgi:hypothetical protein
MFSVFVETFGFVVSVFPPLAFDEPDDEQAAAARAMATMKVMTPT